MLPVGSLVTLALLTLDHLTGTYTCACTTTNVHTTARARAHTHTHTHTHTYNSLEPCLLDRIHVHIGISASVYCKPRALTRTLLTHSRTNTRTRAHTRAHLRAHTAVLECPFGHETNNLSLHTICGTIEKVRKKIHEETSNLSLNTSDTVFASCQRCRIANMYIKINMCMLCRGGEDTESFI